MSSEASSRESSPARSRRRKEPQTPQQKIDEFWGKYKTKAPGKATSIIPQNEFVERAARRAAAKCKAPATTTEQSYEAAAEQCRRKVAQIVRECRRVNQRYRDPHFDLEIDSKLNRRDCLDTLANLRPDYRHPGHFGRGGRYARAPRRRELPKKDREEDDGETSLGGGSVLGLLSMVEKERAPPRGDGDGEATFRPKAVKRVVDVFDEPQFYIDGPTANDVRQGRDGDCWLMAALCTLSNKPGLIERCCIAHDQDVGVYGFVFHRDGEWFSEIIDDKLYLTKPDYDESLFERILWEDRERVNSEEAYRKAYQSNSGALYFAQCVNPNETWLPLLEKAYAKAHGDYSAIEGGYGGEGIEDLTGGVTSEIYTTDILDKEHFWNEELMKVNQDFLFGCSTGVWGRGWGDRKGIVELHAYSVLQAREIDGVRLVLLKNPWGKHEWKGAWSDGSKEWTAEWLQKLDHKFGDDGSFWISYDDLLRKYQAFDRTRLFSPEWKVASIWTTLDISWTLDYHDTKFAFSLSQSGPVVLVFSQLDERYFRGLEGQYRFELSFRVHLAATGAVADSYVVRSQNYYRMNRSVNVELDLDAGEYVVVVKVDAQRNERVMPVEEVVRAHAKERREKLLRIGQAYDLAHAKGKISVTAEEKEAREAYENRSRERERKRMAKYIKDDKLAQKKAVLRAKMMERKGREKEEAAAKARAEKKAARRAARAKAESGDNADGDGKTKSTGTQVDVSSSAANTSSSSEDKKDETPLPEGGETKEDEAYVTAAEDAAEKKPTPSKDADSCVSTEQKHVKIETASIVEAHNVEGSISSTEPGEGAHTPTSSSISSKKPAEDQDVQEDEAYVTAAEDDVEAKPTPAPAEPSTAKAPIIPAKVPSRANSVDVGVQTGPGLPDPPPLRPLHALYRRDPPHSMYAPRLPPPPLPGHHHGRHGPLTDLRHIPPHLRASYAAQHQLRPVIGAAAAPPLGTSSSGSSSSDSALDDDDDENPDDVSEVSEQAIDHHLAQASERARAMQAAAAAEAASRTARGGPPVGGHPGVVVEEEPLDEFEKDPWNAVGVFGLRVYYKMPQPQAGAAQTDAVVKLRVERPNPYVWDDSSDDDEDGQADDEKEEERKQESQVLDVDDSAKDAVGETPPAPGVELVGEGGGEKEGEKGGGELKIKAATTVDDVATRNKPEVQSGEAKVKKEQGSAEKLVETRA